jgi:isocitrate lyase
MDIKTRIQEGTQHLEAQWAQDERWAGITRTYTAEEVVKLRGSVVPECTLGRIGAERLWRSVP